MDALNIDKDTTESLSENVFPVVGIGASAGGLEAFKKLIRAIPHNSGMAYILVQHLHPDHESSLPEILRRETNIPVEEIFDNVKVEPDKIYIIPANKIVVAKDNVLKLSRRPKHEKNMPIDIFFLSLAQVHQSHSVGVVLSGTGTDGTLGLKYIKEQGGITVAQEIGTAAYDSMPQSAIDADVVDFVLSPEKIPMHLSKVNGILNKPKTADGLTAGELLEIDCYTQILTLLRSRKGVDFKYYKQTTVHRRILRRVAILKLEKLSDYLKLLNLDKHELDILFQDMLIPVTAFFRDPNIFQDLSNTIFPELVKDKSYSNPLRIWIAGCSTGEEAYSIGMCLYEYLSEKISTIKIQIFATDISEQCITKARAGIYHKRQLEGVSEIRLQQFFTKINGSYQIKKIIRDMCVFASHNFLKDPPFAKIDLISCRNVLIYMEPLLQGKAFAKFHYSLIEKGILLLGKSETTGSSAELFLPVDKRDKLYSKKPLPGKFMNVASERVEMKFKNEDYGLRSDDGKQNDLQKAVDNIILSNYTPAGVIINEHDDIIQFRGVTGPYLEPSPGKASLNVLKMAHKGLSFELRNALHKSKATNKPFSKENISIDDEKKLVTIEVIPILDVIEPHFLILFKNSTNKEVTDLGEKTQVDSMPNEQGLRIKELEQSLKQAHEDMQSIAEEQEAANEELQSANEELLSGTEELQSLNEELETNKEELESTNEELITVNQELYDRNEQFNKARIYAEGIITTIHEPLLVLTKDLIITSANESFYKNFSLTEKETLGINLFELQNKGWDIPEFSKQLLKVQHQKETFLEWEFTHVFPAIGERTIRCNAQPIPEEYGNHLILLALDDVTARKLVEKIHYIQNLNLILESMPEITFSADEDGSFTYFNNFFLDYSGMSLPKALKSGFKPLLHSSQRNQFALAWSHSIETGENFLMEFQLKRKDESNYCWHICRATPVRNNKGFITSWVGTATDIQDQKIKEQAKDEFISIASHELKTPLTSAKALIQILEQNMGEKKDKDLIYAQKAHGSINRLNELITQLLDVSKMQHGKFGLKMTTFNFNEMLSDAIESVQLTSPNHTIVKKTDIHHDIKGDKERLHQVIINLLTNAVKYSPKANKVIVNAVAEDGILKLSVNDRGIGIKKENIGKIFARYFREKESAIHFQGLGIGLSISSEIIQRHKGKMWVESELGKGSTFYFTIPV
jgi:two-component system CheB/CheR fusion protein